MFPAAYLPRLLSQRLRESEPAVIADLRVTGDDTARREDREVRPRLAAGALAHAETRAAEAGIADEASDRLRRRYEERLQHL